MKKDPTCEQAVRCESLFPDIDAIDGTLIVDLKAYFPVCHRVKQPHIPGWLSDWPEWMPEEGIGL